jgi:tetratricopeptide (TPR) repeat protein
MHRRRIAHFEILEPIGKGGMGVVYRARDTHLDRPVAIKVLPPSFSTNPDRRSRFLREARAAANLNHPNIATVYQFGPAMVDDAELVTPPPGASTGSVEILFLAMELVPGEDLHTLLESGPLPVETALDYAIQMARGLDAAHRAGVTHRDLKPKNVRITPEGAVKILDFGLAKVHGPELPPAEEGAFETTQGMVLGTPPYMAPEQLKGEAVDARSDLYALGVVLYQMFAGYLPFPSRNLLEYAKALASGDGPPSMAEAAVGPQHEAIVRRLLQQDPEARYPSARAVIEALKAVSGWESGVTRPPSAVPRLGRNTDAVATEVRPIVPAGKPPRARWWIGAGVLAALLIGLFLSRLDAGTPATINVVILPFDDQSGVIETSSVLISRLIQGLETELVRLDGVEIISHREAAPLLAQGARLTRIADELGADCLLQGSLNPGQRLNLQLLRGDGAQVQWNLDFPLGEGEVDFDSESEMFRLVALVVGVWRNVQGSLKATHFLDLGEDKMGEIDGLSGDLEMATRLFQLSLDEEPNNVDAHTALSQIYYQFLRHTGDERYLALTREHADRAWAIDAKNIQARIARGRYLRYEKKFEDSVRELTEAVTLAPQSDLANFELAVSQEYSGDYEAAVAHLGVALEQRPGYWFYQNQLGVLLKEVFGRTTEARALFEAALSATKGPEIRWPLTNLATLEIEEGHPDAALGWLNQIPPPINNPIDATNFGNAYFYLGDLEKSLEYFLLVLELGGAESLHYRNIGDVYLELGREEEAWTQYRRAAEVAREQGQAFWRQALYLSKAKACQDARAAAQVSAEQEMGDPDENQILMELAKVHAVCGEAEDSIALIRRSVALGYPYPFREEPEFRRLVGDPLFERIADQAAQKY